MGCGLGVALRPRHDHLTGRCRGRGGLRAGRRNPSHPAINVKWGELSFDARDEGDIPEMRKVIQQKSRVAGMALYMNVVKERFGNMQGNPFDGSNRTK